MCFERKRRFHMHSNRRWQESHFPTDDFHQEGDLPLRTAFSLPNLRPVTSGTKVLYRGLQFYRSNWSQQSQNHHQQDIKLQSGTREHTDILYALKDSCKSELCRTADWDLFKRVSSARDHWLSALCVDVGKGVPKIVWEPINSEGVLSKNPNSGPDSHRDINSEAGNHPKTQTQKLLLFPVQFQPTQSSLLSQTQVKEKRDGINLQDSWGLKGKFGDHLLS